MDINKLVKLVVQSLEAIERSYRQPYESHLYERVLCYEFYHQFRLRMDETNCPFVLHGELDKHYRGMPRIPDFVFHIPSTEKNIAIIQFKSTHNPIEETKEDLRVISEFRGRQLHYEIGILVIFGKVHELEQVKKKLSGISYDTKLLMIFFDIESGKVAFSNYK